MKFLRVVAPAVLLTLLVQAAPDAGEQQKRTPKQALQEFNDLIGGWRGTGVPSGNKKAFWIETQEWGWQFKGKDAWLTIDFDKSKYYKSGELRYLPDKDQYQLTLVTPEKETRTFVGALTTTEAKTKVLTLDYTDPKTKETHRLTFKLLHNNRYLYQAEVRPADREAFSKVFSVGVTKTDGSFASGDGKPECIVSGGLGTSAVTYMGQTYYVCCSGCRAEFNADPAKYVKEYNDRLAKKKKAN
jgi:hypothetical protein